MDKIERLKIFCLVAEKHSFAQVAKALDLPRSTITYAIKGLETEYQVLLFNRTTRKVNLTNEGAQFFQEVKQLILQAKGLDKFKLKNREYTGQIKIGLPLRIATGYLIPYLHEFYEKYPNIKISIHSHDHYSDLIEQRLDCVVRVGNVTNENLIVRPITKVDLYTLASPEYLHKLTSNLEIGHSNHHIMIGYQMKNMDSDFASLVFEDTQIKLPYQLLVEDTESYLHAGLQGLGVIQIPAFDAIPFIESKRLTKIFEQESCLKIPINFLFLESKYRPVYFQFFIDWLESLLKRKLSISS
ncbi:MULTISPECIES: LysR family transcriptional regulator [unclassified Acinetobacter]|uniref:LysR family transcriptional regulator n=1 Tax=unclassified Acinetobacter TaxID=196816 RepID=UPI003AF8AD8F